MYCLRRADQIYIVTIEQQWCAMITISRYRMARKPFLHSYRTFKQHFACVRKFAVLRTCTLVQHSLIHTTHTPLSITTYFAFFFLSVGSSVFNSKVFERTDSCLRYISSDSNAIFLNDVYFIASRLCDIFENDIRSSNCLSMRLVGSSPVFSYPCYNVCRCCSS